jgi:hypothetical protein
MRQPESIPHVGVTRNTLNAVTGKPERNQLEELGVDEGTILT